MMSLRRFNAIYVLLLLVLCALSSGCGGSASGSNSVISQGEAVSATATLKISNASLQTSETAAVSASYVNSSGAPLAGIPVTFSTTVGAFNPSSGVVITDDAGTATIQLLAGDAAGAGIIIASATVSGSVVRKVITFSVATPPLKISTPKVGVTTDLAPGGSTGISVTVTDNNGNPVTTPVDVIFESEFSEAGKASIISPVLTVNGVASTTYTAKGGVGTDNIRISAGGASVTTSVTIASAAASNISFVSATPTNIGLKGMGGLGYTENSTVVFKVTDVNGQPKVGQQVDFKLNTEVGGLALTANSGSTGQDGMVSTIVKAGVIATPVRVTATITGSSPLISTQSDQLVVSTGIPAQDSMSVSLVTLNVEGLGFDGVTDTITVRLADHFHNPVPDGTAVYFTANGGAIDPSCTTASGTCSVTWISQNPRPNSGRAVILAYAVGEESFIDYNGNGVADAGEYTDDSEAFRDDDYDRFRDTTETFIDFDGNGAYDSGDGMYNGVLRSAAATGPKSKHIFMNAKLVMSGSSASTITLSNTVAPLISTVSTTLTVTDVNGNPMPAGTTISVASTADSNIRALTFVPSTISVPNTTLTGPGSTIFDLSVNNKFVSTPLTSENVLVTVTTPRGIVTTKSFTFTY